MPEMYACFINNANIKPSTHIRMNRTRKFGREHVKTIVISIHLAQPTNVTNHTDQEGQIYFLSSLTVGIFGIVMKGAS